MIDITSISSDNWFRQHPEKVLGEVGTSNRYGKEKTVVKATDDLDGIAAKIIGTGIKPEPQPWHLDRVLPQNQSFDKKVAEAIRRTETEAQNPPPVTGLDLIGFDELRKRYGASLTDEELRVWTWYQRGRLFSPSAIGNSSNGWNQFTLPAQEVKETKLQEWLKTGLLCYDGEEYLPATLFFSGNIYARLNKVHQHQSRIEAAIGATLYQQQVNELEKAVPDKLKILAPAEERLSISPIDPFTTNYYLSRLADGTVFEDEVSLQYAFVSWLDNLSQSDFVNGSNSFEIRNYYIGDERFNKNTTPEERIKITRRSQQDAILLFARFLFEALSREDQQKIEHLWNSEYNNFKEYDYSRIPIGFEMNRYFKNAPIDPRPALWDGVKFLTVNGSGIVAFDVGVGKTMTAILAVAQALYTGQCKRPLIVVPNPTYKKWISETIGEFNEDGTVRVNGVLPQYRDRINDFYNLGVEYENRLHEQWPKDYTITFITYEGLMRLGFGDEVRAQLEGQLLEILNQGLDGRDAQKMREEIDAILGNMTSETIANVDDLGFDYIVVDEAHNFKKIFTRVKGDVEEGERQASPYQLSSGEPSGRGLKLFAISQYILLQNNMRNVVLLTATPFTNSPLEIYSMLALVAYQNLEKRGIVNIKAFFDKFINEETEEAITVRGTIEPRPVIKSFNNRQVLQTVIFSSIIYKTGEEAGVPRPKKIVYPYLKDEKGIFLPPEKVIETRLQPTPDQEYWLKAIAQFANAVDGNPIEPLVPKTYYDEYDRLPGRDLMAISLAANCTLSPYLLRIGGENGVKLYNEPEPDYLQYIESSPKLKYVCECIRTVKTHHESKGEPVSGQVIYMNMATGYFPLLKEYLVQQVGYKPAEIEIIIGGMAQAKKERIKEKFLAGEVKIIIGSATIKEGIDLQNRSTVLYNCALDWNPTDIQQLEGRIWRQGNQHSYVRIVTPLIENSLDVFMFQKLEEKTARINNIWYRHGRGNVLKLEDFDPKELKLGLMTDPVERAKTEIRIDVERLEREKTVVDDNVQKLVVAQEIIAKLDAGMQRINTLYEDKRPVLQNMLDRVTLDLKDEEISNTERDRLESKQRTLAELLAREDNAKTRIAVVKRWANDRIRESGGRPWAVSDAYSAIHICDAQTKNFALMDSISKNILAPKNLTLADDLQPLVDEYTAAATELTGKIKQLQSDTEFETRMRAIKDELLEKKKLSAPLMERVQEFTKQNYLLSCLKDIHDCSLEHTMIVSRNKAVSEPPQSDESKAKRLRIAKAKAAALLLKFNLLKQAA